MGEVNTYPIGLAYNVVSNCVAVNGITGSSFSTDGILNPLIIKTIEIPPFNFSNGDIVTFETVMTKQNTNGGYYYGVWWNTTNSMTGARKVWEATNVTSSSVTFIGSTLTFSSVYFRMEIRDELSDTRTRDPNRTSITTTTGQSNDLFGADTNFTSWERIGTQEGLTSIDWTFWNNALSRGGFFIVAGEVENSSDILRCEWIKISGLSTGTFEDPVARLG
jgi:hypothetical protein